MNERSYTVFRHLGAIDTPKGRMQESVGPFLDRHGLPFVFDDLRAAVALAEALERGNRRGGGDHCTNLRFTAGWLAEAT